MERGRQSTEFTADEVCHQLGRVVFELDRDHRCVFLGPGWNDLVGAPPNAPTPLDTGVAFWMHFHNRDLQQLAEAPELLLQTDDAPLVVHANLRTAPVARHVRLTMNKQTASGDGAPNLSGFLEPVGEAAAVGDSPLVRTSGVATWELDVATGELKVSDHWLKLLGINRSQAPTTVEQVWELMHPDDRESAAATLGGFVAAPDGPLELNIRYLTAHRGVRWMTARCGVAEIDEQTGATKKVVGITVDIDATVRASHRPIEEEQLDAAKLASGIAHDFNNLLSVIVGYADLGQYVDDPGQNRKALAEIARVGLRASSLTQRLATFTGRAAPHRVPININDLITGIDGMLRRPLRDDVVLRYELAADVPFVEADDAELEAALLNLTVNARDALPEGGEIKISTHVNNDESVSVTVADDGTGMDAKTLDRVLEPFFTTKPEGKGTGLGLAMVSELMQRIGGRLVLSSEPGTGTTVEMRLPASDRKPSDRPNPEPSLVADLHILVVDGEPELSRLTAEALRQAGHRVTAAVDASSARQLLGEQSFDLIVADSSLAEGELGDDLAELPNTAVLVISGMPDAAAGPPVLSKPFTRAELISAVGAASGAVL